ILPAEEQPLPSTASPTAQSLDYVPESDPEEDPEEDDDEDPEEDPADYPVDGGYDGDDEDESLEDDEDDDVNIEADDDDEEEEHPSPVDSTVLALPAADQAHLQRRQSPPVPTPVWSDAEIARLLAISTPPSSPLSSWSSPLPHITSPPSSGTPPLHLLSTDRREDIPKVTLPPRKRLGISLGPRYEIRESSSAAAARPAGGLREDYGFVPTMDMEIRYDLERDVRYGITDSWDDIVKAIQGTPVVTDVAKFSQRMTKFETRVRRDTKEVYTRLDDEQTGRQLLAGRLNMLFRDRRAHERTARLIKTEAMMSREAWG
ncbi:hypothetical protein Tco_0043823, partial [Tanacetum coccineum]